MTQSKGKPFCQLVETALTKIDDAVRAVEKCQGKLASEEYKALRTQSGHLMDTLYRVGDALCRST